MILATETSTPFALVQDEGSAPADGGGEGGGGMSFIMPIILILGIFWIVLIRPERKKQKERQTMLGAMKKGDKVMTSSGIYGSVTQIQDDVIVLQVADGVRIRFSRAAIQTILSEEKEKAEK